MAKEAIESKLGKMAVSVSLLVAQVVLLGWAVSCWWAYRNNSLFGNGRWISGKDTCKFLFYSYDFLFRPLDKSCVNLADDMAFQEILFKDPEGPARRLNRIRAEVHVARGGYLWLELRKKGMRMLACRLSRDEDYPSGFYLYDGAGEVVQYTPFEGGLSLSDAWRQVDLRRVKGEWKLFVDRTEYGSVPDPDFKDGYFGFKGSGSTRSAVLVKNIAMSLEDPASPGKTWSEREKFHPRRAARRNLDGALLFAMAAVGFRVWRRHIFAGFLPADQRDRHGFMDDAAFALIMLVAALLPPGSAGVTVPAAILAGEIAALVLLGVHRRHTPDAPYERPSQVGVLMGLALVAMCSAAFTQNGENLLRMRTATAERVAGYHPDAFILRPSATESSQPFEVTRPRVVTLGDALMTGGSVYREQAISMDFSMPSNTTMDIVFQQQAYLTRGDPDGEGLPLQRRLVRLSTRPDVPCGLATSTRSRPAPFLRLDGRLRSDGENHIEIRSDDTGIFVVLNGVETAVHGYKPLGFGETGVMSYDGPVTVNQLRVEATASQEARENLMPVIGTALPVLLALVFWFLLGGSRSIKLVDGIVLEWGALFPFAFYLLGGLFMGNDALSYMGRDRLAWLDILLIAAVCSHMGVLIFMRKRIRHAIVLFNVGFVALVGLTLLLVWDQLPESHDLRLRFADEAEAPADVIKGNRRGEGPWYSNNRLIGASTFVWDQRFGGEKIGVPKKKGVVRIFLVGGSQAWGAGAESSSETFAELLEKRLAARGLPVEVFNAGVNGAGTSKILEYYRQLLRAFEPDVIIADVGLNDSAAMRQVKDPPRRSDRMGELVAEFELLLDACAEDGVSAVLCQEPMCMELPLRPMSEIYEGYEAAALARGVPVVKPLDITREKEKQHLVWWDTAHLAPYGHHLMAGVLAPAVEEAVRKRLEAGP